MLNASLLVIVAWAALIRLLPLLAGGGAYHSGGLFYGYAVALRENNFLLPERIAHYTLGGIPYPYPPLPFMAVGGLEALLGTGPELILALNALFSTLAVVTFAGLVAAMPGMPRAGRWMAVLAFATLPGTYLEHLSGEGLAESAGAVVFPLLLMQLYRLGLGGGPDDRPQGDWRAYAWLGVLLGLNVLASPGTSYAVPVVLLVVALARLWSLRRDRAAQREAFGRLALAAVVGLAVSAPYWAQAMIQHGPGIFLATFGNEHAALRDDLAYQGIMFFAASPGGVLIAAPGNLLAIWGFFYVVARREWLLLFLALFLMLVPREGVWLSTVAVALLAGYGWGGVIRPGFSAAFQAMARPPRPATARRLILLPVVLTAILSPLLTVLAYISADHFYDEYVTPAERDHLAWIAANTPPDTTALVLANEIEWFPLLAERTALNVDFGTEWQPDKRRAVRAYNRRLDGCPADAGDSCLLGDEDGLTDVQQLLDLIAEMQDEYPDYFPPPDLVYCAIPAADEEEDEVRRNNPLASPDLIASLRASPAFTVLREDESTVIFNVRK